VKRSLVSVALIGLLGVLKVASAQTPSSSPLPSASVEESVNKVPFYGFGFDFSMGDGTGLNGVGHNYRNDLSFYFEPSWRIGARFIKTGPFKRLVLAGRFSVTRNLSGTDENAFNGNANGSGPQGTCSKLTPSGNGGVIDPTQVGYCNPAANDRRTDYSDLWLTLRVPAIYTIPKIGVNINPSLRFIFPISAESRFSTLELAITPTLGLSKSLWHDRISLSYGLGVTKYFHRDKTAAIDPKTGTASTNGGNPYDGIQGVGLSNFYNDPSRAGEGGFNNTSVSVLNSFSAGFVINSKWSADLLYILIHPWAYSTACNVNVGGMEINTCQNGDLVASNSGSSLSHSGQKMPQQVLWASISYQPLDWLGLSLSWINQAPLQKPDGSYRQGIISTDYNAFTTVFLGTAVSVDKLVARVMKR
jgi:hypothetical protein